MIYKEINNLNNKSYIYINIYTIKKNRNVKIT